MDQVEFLRTLYRSSAAVADHHSAELIAALHVPTDLDDVIANAAGPGRVVFVTGNPGDGKTHIIRRLQDAFPPSVAVCLDANERSDSDLIALVDAGIAGDGLVIAINEGILLDLCRTAAGKPWATIARRKLLQPLIYAGGVPPEEAEARVFDLTLRNNLAKVVIEAALDRLIEASFAGTPDQDGLCQSNVQRLAVPDIRARLVELLTLVGQSGAHATMRDLLGFLSFTLSGGLDERLPYFTGTFEGGVGPLFDAVRRFDPIHRPMPLLDDVLWRYADRASDWVVEGPTEIRRFDQQEVSFIRRKRRAFFEHLNGKGRLELAGDQIDRMFRTLTKHKGVTPRQLIKLINQFFDRGDNNEDSLTLWTMHRYDARATRYASSRWHIPSSQMRLLVPELLPELRTAFPDYQPTHAILKHDQMRSDEGLLVDRALIGALLNAHASGAAVRSGEPIARISAFFDRLARIASKEWETGGGLPEVKLLDTLSGQKANLTIDVETASYVR